ncbi:MAG TPA: GNAT family N-acetyltransferase [Bryobacteraceae bacterium]|nr:GNAT family N-acetyltransferase [Bryobacteraceae bacterium]
MSRSFRKRATSLSLPARSRSVSSGPRVWRAKEDDAAAIADVLGRAFAEYRTRYTDRGFFATTPDAEQILARMREGPVWVATEADRIVGTVSAVLKGPQCYVRGMAIVPEAGGRGIARLLLGAVEGFALASGTRSLALSTTPFLDRAIRLYQRSGFRRTSDGPHDLFGTPLFTMKKDLR